MLIRLVPPTPHPTILFGIVFPETMPPNLPVPPAWHNQLSLLAVDDLELPTSLHALDKSAAITTLLSEVTFDIPVLTVSCIFADGAKEEWPLMGAGFVEALVSVLDDVNDSSTEIEREREREREWERKREQERQMISPHPVKPNKHKKQRSLLMTLVASLLPSSSSSHPPPPPSPPPTLPLLIPPHSDPFMSSRGLRQRARSTLVDIFRQYVLSELSARMPPGGFYTWITESMIRRVSERVAGLVDEAGGMVPDLVQARCRDYGNGSGVRLDSGNVAQPPPFYSDEEACDGEASDDTTDTDGSSLHTPSSSTANTASTFSTDAHFFPSASSHSHSHDAPQLSGSSFAEYTTLSANNLRLRHLLVLASARHVHEMRETKHREAMLEVRSRRRAWLNKSLLVSNVSDGGMRDGGVGMAMPFRKSPLGQSEWNAEDVEETEMVSMWDDGDGEEMLGMGRPPSSARWFGQSRLFPVSEEPEDEDEDEGDYETGLVAELDLELDTLNWPDEDQYPFDLERPKIQPRTRMRTMSMHRLDSFPNPFPHRAPSPPLLCRPLTGCQDVSMFDPEGTENEFGQKHPYERGRLGYPDEEFTLAMDLPFKVNVKEVFSKAGRAECVREMEKERVWTPPGLAVDCR